MGVRVPPPAFSASLQGLSVGALSSLAAQLASVFPTRVPQVHTDLPNGRPCRISRSTRADRWSACGPPPVQRCGPHVLGGFCVRRRMSRTRPRRSTPTRCERSDPSDIPSEPQVDDERRTGGDRRPPAACDAPSHGWPAFAVGEQGGRQPPAPRGCRVSAPRQAAPFALPADSRFRHPRDQAVEKLIGGRGPLLGLGAPSGEWLP